eukprot:7732513-Pyramimonas_sp.AAC.1
MVVKAPCASTTTLLTAGPLRLCAEAIRVRASCLEPIGSRAKKSLGMAFQKAAFECQRVDPVANDQ